MIITIISEVSFPDQGSLKEHKAGGYTEAIDRDGGKTYPQTLVHIFH